MLTQLQIFAFYAKVARIRKKTVQALSNDVLCVLLVGFLLQKEVPYVLNVVLDFFNHLLHLLNASNAVRAQRVDKLEVPVVKLVLLVLTKKQQEIPYASLVLLVGFLLQKEIPYVFNAVPSWNINQKWVQILASHVPLGGILELLQEWHAKPLHVQQERSFEQ